MKIVAAVVTYNRCALLERCLDQLAAQTRAPDEVLVINNASTDGTLQMLASRPVRVISQPNLGSAGGWHRAIAHALEHGFDAVWLMDDDGFPDSAALGQLEDVLAGDFVCASSVVVHEDEPDRFVFPFPLLNAGGNPVLLARRRKLRTVTELKTTSPEGRYPFAHLFNGALISTRAIRDIGNVERRYFMFGDEVDYFLRLSRIGKVLSITDAIHRHPDVSRRALTSMKFYYYIKNTIIINHRYLDLALLRDALTVGVALWRVARRNGVTSALAYVAGSDAACLYRAIIRGACGQLGKDF